MPEDLSAIFKPEAKTIMKIFGDADSYYQIPDYQRPYSWNDEQIEQLWDDIYSAMESNDESYFLGPMILIRTNDGYFEVVDGQQRLTTLMILFCVLRDLYFKDDNRILNAIKSLVNQKYRLRLITQLHYQNQFEQEILDGIKLPQNKLTKKQREKNKFINAALIFRNKLESIEDEDEQITKLVDYLLNKVIMITITCSKQSFAIKLFQVLNTRGLDLTNTDLIKSYLYGRLDDERKRKQFVATWGEIETISKQIEEDVEGLFTYYEYYLLARNPKYSLYDELTRTPTFKEKDSNEVIYLVKKFIDNFSVISQWESKLIFSFWYLPNQVFWKAILTTAKMQDFDDFERLCKELRKFYYCYWIAGYTTSKIKQFSFNLISWIKRGRKLDEIKKEIGKKMADDDVLNWMKESLKSDVYGNSWLKPLLLLIEYEQTDNSKISCIELDRKLHADHILPEKWFKKEEWKKMWTEEQAEKWLHKIGNLTLLSGKKNLAQHNDPPSKKAEMYKKGHGGTTAFEISKRIIERLETGTWTEDDVKDRQKWIIGQVEKILGLNLNGGTAHAEEFDTHVHKYTPFQADIREFKESKVADGVIENVDTIVVPANKEGFEETFLGKNRWYTIRISKSMIGKIKYIAGYQTAPTSAITHYAEVSKIERYKDTDKFIVYFTDQANKIGPLKLIPKSKGKVKAPRALRYTTFNKLRNAKSLDEVFL